MDANSALHSDMSKKLATTKKVNVPKPDALKSNSLPLHVASSEDPSIMKDSTIIKPVSPVSMEVSKLQDTTTGYAVTPNGLKPMKIDEDKTVTSQTVVGIKDALKGKETGMLIIDITSF